MNNLLTDPVIRTRLEDGTVAALSLPEIYAEMSADRIVAFPALRPHQRHGWHAFLAQLGVIAVHHAKRTEFPETAEEWRSLLRDLTPKSDYPNDEPWCLVVEDPEQPAFLQCPDAGKFADYKGSAETPDDLDVLVTSKNHDLKRTIAVVGQPEDWVFALVNVQTMAPFLGAGNYNIARMNGGHASRPCLGLAPWEGNLGAHLWHDMRRMLNGRDALLADPVVSRHYQREGGAALLWLETWDGKSSRGLNRLDPYFIEICRRIRLKEENGILLARTASSKKARIDAKEFKGNLGDFWTPVEIKESKAFSVSSQGFAYKKLVKLLSKEYKQPVAMRVNGDARTRWRLVARAVCGGQGKTEGYHERTDIAFSGKTSSALFTDKREELGKIAEMQLEEIAEVEKALKNAIATATSGGKDFGEITKANRTMAIPFVRRLDSFADTKFFDALDRRFVSPEDPSLRADFCRSLIDEARALVEEGLKAIPCPSIRRHRAHARARRAFWGTLRSPKGLFSDQPQIFERKGVAQ